MRRGRYAANPPIGERHAALRIKGADHLIHGRILRPCGSDAQKDGQAAKQHIHVFHGSFLVRVRLEIRCRGVLVAAAR